MHYGVVLSVKELVLLISYGVNAVSTYALIEDTSLCQSRETRPLFLRGYPSYTKV